MPRQTFHFGPDSEKVLGHLLEVYVAVSALTELLAGIVEEEGIVDGGIVKLARSTVKDCDRVVARVIRHGE